MSLLAPFPQFAFDSASLFVEKVPLTSAAGHDLALICSLGSELPHRAARQIRRVKCLSYG
jgi:hypothetical protein